MERIYMSEKFRISEYKNRGMKAEQNLAFMLTGEIRKHDRVAFDIGSDIPEFELSVKSENFTLASAKRLKATTKAEQITEYFERVHSTKWAYVSNDNYVYIMNKIEFAYLVEHFTRFERESERNGKGWKVKMTTETKAFKKWIEEKTC